MMGKYSLSRDLLYSAIVLLVVSFFSFLDSNINFLVFSSKETANILTVLFGTLIGFVITAMTILLMFDYKRSPILSKIKRAGLYNQIFERYLYTVMIMLVSLVYFITVGIFWDSLFTGYQMIINGITVFLLTASLIRLYRSIKLLKIILDVLH